MFVINGIDRLFYPKIASLVIDIKPSLTLLCRSLDIEQFPKGCFDGESSLFFYQIVIALMELWKAIGQTYDKLNRIERLVKSSGQAGTRRPKM